MALRSSTTTHTVALDQCENQAVTKIANGAFIAFGKSSRLRTEILVTF